jgi:hypothetical protein
MPALFLAFALLSSASAHDYPLPCRSVSGETYTRCLGALRPGKPGERAPLVISPAALRALGVRGGLAAAWSPGLDWMYADRSGAVLIEHVATLDNGPDEFRDGLVRVDYGGKCGYADRSGALIFPRVYDGCLPFDRGKAEVCRDCRTVCADKGCEAHRLEGGTWTTLRLGRAVLNRP